MGGRQGDGRGIEKLGSCEEHISYDTLLRMGYCIFQVFDHVNARLKPLIKCSAHMEGSVEARLMMA